MIPPRGFKAELYPLRHRLVYSFGLTNGAAAKNTAMITLVKNYKSVTDPNLVIVNPHDTDLDYDAGSICAPMSIIDKLSLSMSFNLTEDGLADGVDNLKVQYMPIFTSFPHRLEEVDIDTSLSVASILELTKDATQEDVTPAHAIKLVSGAAANHKAFPVSTVNFTEVFGTMNLTTDTQPEGIPWDSDVFFKASSMFTNKGALGSCHGRMRTLHLTRQRPQSRVFIKTFVPRDVRRIVPYSFFGMLVHVPMDDDIDSPYYTGVMTGTTPCLGFKCIVQYHEWNPQHNQEVTA